MSKFDKYSWAAKPEPIDESEIIRTEVYDVVIVGAGLSGVSAATRSVENGLKTMLLEKGRRNSARGLHVGAANSRALKANGIVNDINELCEEWVKTCHHDVKIDLIRLYLKESEGALDWILDKADAHDISYYIFGGGYHGQAYREFVCTHIFSGGVEGIADMLLAEAMEGGLNVSYYTTASQLIKEGDKVTGVIAKTKEGYVKYLAEKGVILSTGDISGNREMCEDLAPLALEALSNINHHAHQLTGDGHKMGIWAGADMQRGPFPCAVHLMAFSINTFFFLMVNQNGKRYMNEDSWAQGKATYTIHQDPEHPWGYVIFDSNYLRDLEDTIQYGGGLFWDSTVRPYGTPFDTVPIKMSVETCVEEGQDGWRDDTLEGLAAQLGIPPENLVATVERYNELCANGYDADYGKRPELLTPIKEGPFYALKTSGVLLHIPGGLCVDCDMQVLDEGGKKIPGLYAIGNCAGNLYAVDYPLNINGNNHGRCITFGKYLADKLAGVK